MLIHPLPRSPPSSFTFFICLDPHAPAFGYRYWWSTGLHSSRSHHFDSLRYCPEAVKLSGPFVSFFSLSLHRPSMPIIQLSCAYPSQFQHSNRLRCPGIPRASTYLGHRIKPASTRNSPLVAQSSPSYLHLHPLKVSLHSRNPHAPQNNPSNPMVTNQLYNDGNDPPTLTPKKFEAISSEAAHKIPYMSGTDKPVVYTDRLTPKPYIDRTGLPPLDSSLIDPRFVTASKPPPDDLQKSTWDMGGGYYRRHHTIYQNNRPPLRCGHSEGHLRGTADRFTHPLIGALQPSGLPLSPPTVRRFSTLHPPIDDTRQFSPLTLSPPFLRQPPIVVCSHSPWFCLRSHPRTRSNFLIRRSFSNGNGSLHTSAGSLHQAQPSPSTTEPPLLPLTPDQRVSVVFALVQSNHQSTAAWFRIYHRVLRAPTLPVNDT